MTQHSRKTMRSVASRTPSTVGELTEYLKALEAIWSADDTRFLGEFKNQKIYLSQPEGLSLSYIHYHGGYGLVCHPHIAKDASSPAAPRGKEPVAFATCHHCAVCGEPQYTTSSGITCSNGHGGAPSEEDGK